MTTLYKHSVNGGGSSKGLHRYLNGLRCGREVRLTAEFGPEKLILDENKVDAKACGTVFHAMAEAYHSGQPLPHIDDFEENKQLGATYHEAYRVFVAYAASHSTDFWGGVVGTEVELYDETLDLTGRLDLVTRSDEGIVINDYKVTSRTSDFHTYDQFNFQRIAYPYLWNTEHPTDVCWGFRFIHIIRTKEVRFAVEKFEPPTLNDVEILKQQLDLSKQMIANNVPIVTQCALCRFKNTCDRRM